MKYHVIAILIGLVAFTSHANESWTQAQTEALVQSVRNPPIAECWAIMSGTVHHRARGKATIKLPIELRARFSPVRSLAQLIFNNDERYLVGQSFSEGATGTSVIPQLAAPEGAVTLQDIGIRPSDITLSFLYWDFERDLGADRFKAQTCRILEFKHPEADETARVWVSVKHGFPLRVMWYMGEEKEPYRQLEITGLKKVHDIWIVSEVRVSNAGWRTQIDFSKIDLQETTPASPVPADLFLQTPE